MCHISEFQKILPSNYTRIGLLIYVEFRLGTRQNIIQIMHEKMKITLAFECVTKSTITVFVVNSLQFVILTAISAPLKHKTT